MCGDLKCVLEAPKLCISLAPHRDACVSHCPDSSTGDEIPARIVYRENFGILAKAEEAVGKVQAGDRFWTKWCGALAPMSRTPIVEVVHAVKN